MFLELSHHFLYIFVLSFKRLLLLGQHFPLLEEAVLASRVDLGPKCVIFGLECKQDLLPGRVELLSLAGQLAFLIAELLSLNRGKPLLWL